MSRPSKLLRKALANLGSLCFAELRQRAVHLGFVHDRTRGAHRIFTQPGLRRPLSLQDVGGMTKPLQVRQLLTAARQLGLIDSDPIDEEQE
ncbi:MAG: hypothetical protein GF330_11805 [Candidatus Eisenbacteria bacterium]|nr:hypothetical protein [Candidatus Eisenbacteria bacterium]